MGVLGRRYISRCWLIMGDRIAEREKLPLELLDLKTVLMPRQWFLEKLDPDGSRTVPELRMILEPHVRDYRAVVLLHGQEPPGLTVKKALGIYKKFNFMSRQPDVPVQSKSAGPCGLGHRDGI